MNSGASSSGSTDLLLYRGGGSRCLVLVSRSEELSGGEYSVFRCCRLPLPIFRNWKCEAVATQIAANVSASNRLIGDLLKYIKDYCTVVE